MDEGARSAAAAAGDMVRVPPPATPITQLAQNLLGTVVAVFRIVRWILHFMSITLPSLAYRLVHYSMTVQVTFPVLALWCTGTATVAVLCLRYGYWNRYEFVREDPIQKVASSSQLPPTKRDDDVGDEERNSFHSYLDEFLDAIRIFGFLERPVFHELTRHLQTRRVLAGDELPLGHDSSFYIVVDGHVQVFAPTPDRSDTLPHASRSMTLGPDGAREYQLVNDVKRGGTLSSLFTILRLFTEHVQLGFTSDDADVPPLRSSAPPSPAFKASASRAPPTSDMPSAAGAATLAAQSTSDGPSAPPQPGAAPPSLPQTPTSVLSRLHTYASPAFTASPGRRTDTSSSSDEFDTVARAVCDSTLAVIPADAFRRLTVQYPNAASHIVQVILTRLARVTFHTSHQYLGLTREVMKTEYAINENAKVRLPAAFYEPANMAKLRDMCHPERSPSGGPNAALSPTPTRAGAAPASTAAFASMHEGVRPGDLHSMVESPMCEPNVLFDPGLTTPRRPSVPASAASDGLNVRREVMRCIVNSIGLTQAILPDLPAALASPMLVGQPRSALAGAYSSLSRLDASVPLSDLHEHESATQDARATKRFSPLDADVDIRFVPQGTVLARAGQSGAGLFYVIEGSLAMHVDDDEDSYLFSVEQGGVAGYLSSLLGVPSYVNVVARQDCYIGVLPVQVLERLVERRPDVLLTLSKRLLSLLPPLIVHMDAALDWVHVSAGEVLFREGDEGDSLYIVINGRLRAQRERGDGPPTLLSEYSQGHSVGELEVITKGARTMSLHSIRDSELARMPTTLFNAIALWHPPVTVQISRIIARRMHQEMEDREKAQRMSLPPHITASIGRAPSTHNLKTVAVLPASQGVPVTDFARQLQAACAAAMSAPVALLSQRDVIRALGRHSFSRMGKLKLAGWLADQEQLHGLVLFLVDATPSSSWASTAVRHADCILLVGLGDEPYAGEMERLLLRCQTTARKELVLLHSERSVTPGTTREWLKPRPWVDAHHHVELGSVPQTRASSESLTAGGPRPVEALRTLTRQLRTRIRRSEHTPPLVARPAQLSDFARLARRLCGASIGLVLGGGGARGCAHIGVLRALEELGIPIDMVGGTSIGSFVGGLYARDGAAVSSHGRAKRFAGRMASLWRFVTDVTYPLVSYTTGHEFNRGIFKCFNDTHIEDMWLPYFCNTTNITWSRMEVHTSGYAWRYIRASMTLAGLVPPMIDQGNMLVDGGYTDNLPVSIMLAQGARTVLAVDVSSTDDTSPQHYGDTLSGWWVLLNRLNPWSSMRKIPNIPDIQSRLTYTTSVKMLEDAKADPACLYLRMPVEQYGTLEFGKYMEILTVGYDVAIEALRQWQDSARLPSFAHALPAKAAQRPRARRNSL